MQSFDSRKSPNLSKSKWIKLFSIWFTLPLTINYHIRQENGAAYMYELNNINIARGYC